MSKLFNVQDANQYLAGVWVGVKGDGKETPWFCTEAFPSDESGGTDLRLLRRENPESGMSEKIISCDDELINIACPTLGAINLEDICIHLSRRNQRQWRRGFRSSHANFFDPGLPFRHYVKEDGRSRIPSRDTKVSTLIDAIWNPEYFSLEGAVASIYDGSRTGAAISKDFYIYCDQQLNLPAIGYNNLMVGTVNKACKVSLFKDCVHLTESLSEVMANK